jgi:2-oxo-3-hexenedioate decarboxylase
LALKAIVDDMARHPDWTVVSVGEVVTTGTITEPMPILPGETWTTVINGAPLSALCLRLLH